MADQKTVDAVKDIISRQDAYNRNKDLPSWGGNSMPPGPRDVVHGAPFASDTTPDAMVHRESHSDMEKADK